MAIKSLDTLQLFAASKAFKVKDGAARPAVGTHHVDYWVHIQGNLKVGADVPAEITPKIDALHLLKVALSKLNPATLDVVVAEGLKRMEAYDAAEAAKEAGDKNAVKALKALEAEDDNFKEEVEKAILKLKAKTKGTRAGAVSFSGVTETTDEPIFVKASVPTEVVDVGDGLPLVQQTAVQP